MIRPESDTSREGIPDDEPVRPGVEAVGVAQARQVVPGVDQRLLHGVLCPVRVEKARVRRIPMADDPVDDMTRIVADRDELERGFRDLTAEHRAVLVLHYFLGFPITEIAETLGIPVGTAASRLHYAVDYLRSSLAADERKVVPLGHRA